MSTGTRVGIDVGGTFTDFVFMNVEDATTTTMKVPTTADDPSRGIIEGLASVFSDFSLISGIAHGTTAATNALIERNGARVAFLTTEGHRDTLEMRRSNREELYDAQWVPPPPLVPRRHRYEVRERLTWNGEVARPLDEEHLEELIETLRQRKIEAVAICLLHSYQHPEHEDRVKAIVKKALPNAFVTVSHDCSEEFREFERGSTVAANAFVGPIVHKYMSNLHDGLIGGGFTSSVHVMQSNGGVCSLEEAAELPVKLARSGPAGGAMALEEIARMTGERSLVGIDIGGTSADVCIVVDGRPKWTSPLVVEWGMPLLLPSVDVISVGAGGGSLAWIDAGNGLHMGPHSAGASPGPACYGLGGDRPTATDAHVALGRIDTDRFLHRGKGDRVELATRAIDRHVAQPMGMSVAEAAEGMLTILDSTMLSAIRFVTLQKGYDPRGFTLVGFGGGGPLHVAALARELGMKKALVPVHPGVLSAWGMLTVDMVQDRNRTILRRRRAMDSEALGKVLTELRGSIERAFQRQSVTQDSIEYEYFLDMQYYGQAYSLPIGLGGAESSGIGDDDIRLSEEGVLTVPLYLEAGGELNLSDGDLDQATNAFHDEHLREYGHADRDQEVQFVHARVFGRVRVERPNIEPMDSQDPDSAAALTGSRNVTFGGISTPTPIYSRDLLQPGNQISGPALIEEDSSTTVLPPMTRLSVDGFGNLVIDIL